MSTTQVCECGHAVTMHPDGRIGKRRLDGEWSCLDPYCRCTRTQASFQVVVPPDPDLCACGHGRAMHFDEDGDHNGPCLWQVHNDAPFCKCDMWHRKPGEDEFLGVPVSEWRQIAAEINCRRGPDGSLLKRFRELLEVSDMRAALLKKRSAPSPSPALACALKGCHRDAVPKHAHCLQHEAELMLECGMLTNGLTASDVRAVLRQDAQSYNDEDMAKALNERLFQHRPPHPSPACKWEADHQRECLISVDPALAEEFPWGCDAIEHVAVALLAARAKAKPSPALAAIVEVLDGYADLLETIAGGRIGHAPNRVYADLLFDVEAIQAKWDALNRARASLPKEGV